MTTSPILLFHIAAGSLGLGTGAIALLASKGSPLHRTAGTLFFATMLAMSISGGLIAYAMPNMLTLVVAALTAYLIATAWVTIRRHKALIGLFDFAALIVGIWIFVAASLLGFKVATGSMQEYTHGFAIPAAIYFVWAAIALLAIVFDITVLVRRGVKGSQRIARHLWRMSTALLIAALSFFTGQSQVFPAPWRDSPALYLPALVVLIAMLYWLVRVIAVRPREHITPPSESIVVKWPK